MGFRGQHKNKRDENEPQIVDRLEWHGLLVERIDYPFDLLVTDRTLVWPVEVKMEGAQLTPNQKRLLAVGFPLIVLRSTLDVDEFVQEARWQSARPVSGGGLDDRAEAGAMRVQIRGRIG